MKYRAAIIGCGRIASTFDDDPLRDRPWTHAGAYQATPEISIAAASDPNRQMLDNFGTRWNVAALYPDYRQMLAEIKPDIVSVCTPTATHHELVVAAAQSGAKAIFCEKPMALTVAECDHMIDVCRTNNVRLAINHVRRWDNDFCFPYELLRNNEIGEIISIAMYTPNTLAESGSHAFDLLSWYGGPAEWVCARGDKPEQCRDPKSKNDPGAGGYISFKSGASGYYIGSTTKNYLMFEVDIVGTNGRVRIADNGITLQVFKPEKSKHYGEYFELTPSNVEEHPRPNRMISAVADLLEALKTGREPRSTGADGRAALELIAAFRISTSRGGEKVRLPLEGVDRQFKILPE